MVRHDRLGYRPHLDPATRVEQDITALRDEDRLTPDMVFRDPYLDKSGIHLAEFPPKELLEQKLHQSIQLARKRLARLK